MIGRGKRLDLGDDDFVSGRRLDTKRTRNTVRSSEPKRYESKREREGVSEEERVQKDHIPFNSGQQGVIETNNEV